MRVSVVAIFGLFAFFSFGNLSVRAQEIAPSRGAGSGKVFTFRLLSEPETLDWNRAHTPIETHLLVNLMEGLLAVTSDLKVTSALAEKWDLSPDGKTYRFTLKKGIQWSDGVPLRAHDFLYSWKRLLTPSTAAAYSYLLFDIEGAEAYHQGKIQDFSQVGIQALDDLTLQVKLKQPVAHWIYIPSFWVTFPLRQDLVEKYGSRWTQPGKMATVGPYVLSSHQLETKLVLKSNPKYHGKRGNLEEVVGLIVKEDSTALTLYESGKLDFLPDLPLVDFERLKKRSDLKTFPYLKTGYLGFVVNQPSVSQTKLRQAIAQAIDKKKLANLLGGGQKPAFSFVPPPMMASSEAIGLGYHPDKARALWNETGVKLTFILPNTEKNLMTGQFIQEELKKNLGIEVTLQPFDNKTFRSELNLRKYPLFLMSWSADYPDPDNFLSIFLSESGNNRTHWKDAGFDQKVAEARGLRNQKDRKSIYLNLQKKLIEENVVVVPLYYEPNHALVRPYVKNLELNPLNYLDLRKVNLE